MGEESGITISEIAQAYRVSLRTLRFYEERGLLKPKRIGHARYYTEQDETRLQVILKAKTFGFTLAEIAQLIESTDSSPDRAAETSSVLSRSQIETQIRLLEQRREATDAAIQELCAALTDQSLIA